MRNKKRDGDLLFHTGISLKKWLRPYRAVRTYFLDGFIQQTKKAAAGGSTIMRRALLSFILLSIPFCAELFAQSGASSADETKAVPPVYVNIFLEKDRKITIEEAVRLALDRNPALLSARLDAAMSDSSYRQFQAKYDTYFNADAGVKYQQFPERQYDKYGAKDQTVYDATASLSRSISTGTTIAAGVTQNYTRATDPYGNVGKGYYPVMFASVKQELLKNSFGYNDRAQEKLLDNASKMQRNGQIQVISGLVAGALVDIWNVSLMRSARDIAGQSLRETKRVRDVVAGNVRVGINENYELNSYNAMLAVAESSFASAEQSYRNAVRAMFSTFNYEISGDVPEITNISVLSDTFQEINIDAAIKIAYAKRIDFSNATLALENAKTDYGLNSNSELPSLSVTGTITSLAAESSATKANGKAMALDTPGYELRVAASYPLGQSAEATKARDSAYRVKQAELALEKTKLDVKNDVVGKIEQVKVGYTAYQKMKTAREESERYYKNILANLRMGKISIAVVKNALDQLNATRQNELNALVQYNVSLLYLDLATNELLEKYKVDVNKYIDGAK
jgi:outer membrane protein TolC